jgi:hypothetical protein
MRAVREQPRLVVAKAVTATCLLLVGIASGATLDRGDTDRMHATQLRLVSAQGSLADDRSELRAANKRVAQANAEARRARSQARALARSDRRLRDELAAGKRAGRRIRSKAHE